MRLVYFGTPQSAVPPLQALHAAGHDIVLVVSRADARRGRGSTTSASPVKAAAVELGLTVTDDPNDALAVDADLGVVVAYGRIIRPDLLAHLPMVNLHFSLLPRWRGAAPVERAILAGDDVTGVCVMAVEEGLDTGGVYARREVEIPDDYDASSLRDELVRAGSELLVQTLAQELPESEPQPEDGVTYAHKIAPEDLRLDWNDSTEALRRIIGLGGAWTQFRGRRFKILAAVPAGPISDHGATDTTAPTPVTVVAAPGEFVGPTEVRTGDGVLRLVTVQPEGKAPMDAAAWANGARPLGDRLDHQTSERA